MLKKCHYIPPVSHWQNHVNCDQNFTQQPQWTAHPQLPFLFIPSESSLPNPAALMLAWLTFVAEVSKLKLNTSVNGKKPSQGGQTAVASDWSIFSNFLSFTKSFSDLKQSTHGFCIFLCILYLWRCLTMCVLKAVWWSVHLLYTTTTFVTAGLSRAFPLHELHILWFLPLCLKWQRLFSFSWSFIPTKSCHLLLIESKLFVMHFPNRLPSPGMRKLGLLHIAPGELACPCRLDWN